MNKSTLLCGLTCSGLMLTVMPPVGVAAEKFECPLPCQTDHAGKAAGDSAIARRCRSTQRNG